MKKLLFLLFIISFDTEAQLTLTKAANAPIAGYSYGENFYDSTIAIPKITGTNKSWNFTSLNFFFASGNTFTYVAAASTPYFSEFPTAELALTPDQSSFDYYDSQTNALENIGFSSGSYSYTFSDPMTIMTWPFSYGNSNSDYFDFTLTSPTSTVVENINGVMTVSATGSGTVTLPGGQKFNNCLQVKRNFSYLYNDGADTYTVNTTEYEYWTSTYRNPIISIQYSTVKEQTLTTKDCDIRTNKFADVGIDGKELDEIGFVVYPNPVKEKLSIVFRDNSVADEMELYDASGKLVLQEKNTNALDVSKLSKGLYVVKVRSENSQVQKQVIIAE